MQVTLDQLNILLGGRLEGPGERTISGIKSIIEAGPNDLAFLDNYKYAKFLFKCQAGVVLVHYNQKVPKELAVIRVDNPYLSYAKLLTILTAKSYYSLGIHDRAVVEESAYLGYEISIHAFVYIGHNSVIKNRVVIYPGVYIGSNVYIDDDTVLYPNVVIYDGCIIGKRCFIHAGTVIGSDGYGFISEASQYYKIPQAGIVRIDDDVEIGANNTIDRAVTGQTWIQRGVKTDNLVHIGHNCIIGKKSLLVAQVGISGSCNLGERVILAGQVGLAGHIKIGDGVKVGGQSGVAHNISSGDIVSGTPAMPHKLWLRISQLIKRLPDIYRRIKLLEDKVDNELKFKN